MILRGLSLERIALIGAGLLAGVASAIYADRIRLPPYAVVLVAVLAAAGYVLAGWLAVRFAGFLRWLAFPYASPWGLYASMFNAAIWPLLLLFWLLIFMPITLVNRLLFPHGWEPAETGAASAMEEDDVAEEPVFDSRD